MRRDKNYAGLYSFFQNVSLCVCVCVRARARALVCVFNSRVLHNKVSTFVFVEVRSGPSTYDTCTENLQNNK